MKIKSEINRMGKKSKILLVTILIAGISFGFVAKEDTDIQIIKSLDIFVTMFQQINLLYVDDVTPKELVESGIEGMLSSLDPYTTYIPEEEVDDFKFMTTGKYGGIGALIRKAGDYTMISEPYQGFPAQRSGLLAGDTILAIDNISTKGKSISDVSGLLKGKPNTNLELKIKRLGVDSVITKSFDREQVAIPNVPYYGLMQDNTGYIMLSNFMKNASKEVKDAFIDLKEKGATAIVLDLRGNPGGLLDEAIKVSNIWLPKNQEIVSTKGKNKNWDKSYYTENEAIDTTIPLAVIVSRGSASASEIVAGSLQDLDRAAIIGERTFGKGLVQTTRPLSYNAHLKITTAKYYIPSGRCIQALDYSHRNEDGSVGYVPDSLKTEFKTKNGRPVWDGGGINPDIKIESDKPGNITMALFAKNIIFDFATIFRAQHEEIEEPVAFKITDEIYKEFTTFVLNQDFEYSTKSSESLHDLVKIAKREGYYEQIKDDLKTVEDRLHGNTEKDLETFRKEIEDILADEIVSRYYFQKGRIETSIQNDPEIKKAVDLLRQEDALSDILHGSYTGETIFAVRTH